jgi:YVTN family beta-propeller protein
MKIDTKISSLAKSLTVLILFFILVSSTASAATTQSASLGPYAYIANYGNGTVSVIDTTNNKVTATIPVGSHPVGVAATPDGKKVFVMKNDLDNGSFSVIDTLRNKVTATIYVGMSPSYVAITPDGKKAYSSQAAYDGDVYVIDTVQNKVLTTVNIGSMPEEIIVNPEGTKVYVANRANNSISIIDTSTDKVIKTVNVGDSSSGIAVSPDGKKIYVAKVLSNTMSVIDTATDTVIKSQVAVGTSPWGVAVSPDGRKVYVLNLGNSPNYNGTVSVIDTATNNIVATVNVGTLSYEVTVSPDGTKLYVTNSGSNTVSVIDTATNKVTATVNGLNNPQGVAIAKVPDLIVPIANFSSNVTKGYVPLPIKFTDLSKNAATREWDFGDGNTSTDQNPMHTYASAGSYIVNLTVSDGNDTDSKLATINVLKKPESGDIYTYVANSGSNTIYLIDGSTDAVIATIPVGIHLWELLPHQMGKRYMWLIWETLSLLLTQLLIML